MNLHDARELLDKAAVALDEAFWAEQNEYRRSRIRSLIIKNDQERLAVLAKIFAGNTANYQPLADALGKAKKDLEWARNKVEDFTATTNKLATIVAWATSILALL